jgi:hypothetical protein
MTRREWWLLAAFGCVVVGVACVSAYQAGPLTLATLLLQLVADWVVAPVYPTLHMPRAVFLVGALALLAAAITLRRPELTMWLWIGAYLLFYIGAMPIVGPAPWWMLQVALAVLLCVCIGLSLPRESATLSLDPPPSPSRHPAAQGRAAVRMPGMLEVIWERRRAHRRAR